MCHYAEHFHTALWVMERLDCLLFAVTRISGLPWRFAIIISLVVVGDFTGFRKQKNKTAACILKAIVNDVHVHDICDALSI